MIVGADGRPAGRPLLVERPLGMRASGSHIIDMTGTVVEPEWFLGSADDYIRQPWFSGGAIRFLAVQVGGMHASLRCSPCSSRPHRQGLQSLTRRNRLAPAHGGGRVRGLGTISWLEPGRRCPGNAGGLKPRGGPGKP